jgi:hypothetical protein
VSPPSAASASSTLGRIASIPHLELSKPGGHWRKRKQYHGNQYVALHSVKDKNQYFYNTHLSKDLKREFKFIQVDFLMNFKLFTWCGKIVLSFPYLKIIH